MRFNIRRLMVGVAVLGVLLGVAAALSREYERMFPSTPASWAWQKAASWKELADQPWWPSTMTDQESALSIRYRALAEAFEHDKERWVEGTYYGPFTDILHRGDGVLVRPTMADVWNDDEGREVMRKAFTATRGQAGVVVKDWARDQDDCSDTRSILVQIVGGLEHGKLVGIERIYLRRKP